MKNCLYCQKELVKRETEHSYLFKRRKFCNQSCGTFFNPPTKRPEVALKISQSSVGKIMSAEFKEKCRQNNLGRKQTTETIQKRVLKNTGKKRTEEQRLKISLAQRGEKAHWWLGGLSLKGYGIGWTKTLREEIKRRDNYTCQECKTEERELSVHHIDYNKDNNQKENLISLCRKCHTQTNFNRGFWQSKLQMVFDELETA